MSDTTRDLMHGSGFGKGYDYAPGWREGLTARLQGRVKRVVQGMLWSVLGAFGRVDRLMHAWQSRPALTPSAWHPRKILVIRTDLLGDVVMTLPAIHALRRAYPDAVIDVVVLPATAPLIADHPDIDNVIRCDPNGWLSGIFATAERAKIAATIRHLRGAHYNLAVSVCGDWASIIARLSGARRRVGFAGEAYPGFLTDPVPGKRYDLHHHETEYGLLLAERAGGIVDAPGVSTRRPRLPVSDVARAAVERMFADHDIAPDQPVIALHAGSGNGQAKRWPLPAWARLADLICDQTTAAVILIGSPGDKPLAQAVLHRMHQPARAIDMTGKTTLPELAALLARCAVVVTGDSGPLHVAEAVGTRVVAIHGPTDPAQSGPCGPDAIVLRRAIWCSPCYDSRATAECRFHNPVCMKGIAPADVLAATLTQLQRSSAPVAAGL